MLDRNTNVKIHCKKLLDVKSAIMHCTEMRDSNYNKKQARVMMRRLIMLALLAVLP